MIVKSKRFRKPNRNNNYLNQARNRRPFSMSSSSSLFVSTGQIKKYITGLTTMCNAQTNVTEFTLLRQQKQQQQIARTKTESAKIQTSGEVWNPQKQIEHNTDNLLLNWHLPNDDRCFDQIKYFLPFTLIGVNLMGLFALMHATQVIICN